MNGIALTVTHDGKDYHGEILRIDSTTLGSEDHGVMVGYLNCKGYGTGISVGLSLDTYNRELEQREGTAYGLDWIKQVLLIVGVDTWEQLPGKRIIALFESSGILGNTSVGIANIDSGKAFIFDDHAELWRERSVGLVDVCDD